LIAYWGPANYFPFLFAGRSPVFAQNIRFKDEPRLLSSTLKRLVNRGETARSTKGASNGTLLVVIPFVVKKTTGPGRGSQALLTTRRLDREDQ
jgi:hypothetical protein